jgi:hypothetical protein
MVTAQVPLVYDELLDYLVEKAAPEEILAFRASEKAEARAADLLDRNNAGTLTPEEAIELQQLLYFDSRISVLKTQAALALKKK